MLYANFFIYSHSIYYYPLLSIAAAHSITALLRLNSNMPTCVVPFRSNFHYLMHSGIGHDHNIVYAIVGATLESRIRSSVIRFVCHFQHALANLRMPYSQLAV
jgi:hypothetical protein